MKKSRCWSTCPPRPTCLCTCLLRDLSYHIAQTPAWADETAGVDRAKPGAIWSAAPPTRSGWSGGVDDENHGLLPLAGSPNGKEGTDTCERTSGSFQSRLDRAELGGWWRGG